MIDCPQIGHSLGEPSGVREEISMIGQSVEGKSCVYRKARSSRSTGSYPLNADRARLICPQPKM